MSSLWLKAVDVASFLAVVTCAARRVWSARNAPLQLCREEQKDEKIEEEKEEKTCMDELPRVITLEATIPVTILTANDVYCAGPDRRGVGGFASLGTLLEQHKRELERQGRHVLVCINGDFLGGSTLASTTEGAAQADIMNALGVDVVVLGNHEFDFGTDTLEKIMESTNFHWLGANVRHTSDNRHIGKATSTLVLPYSSPVTVSGATGAQLAPQFAVELRLGLFGVCTAMTPRLSWPGPGIAFEDEVLHAKQAVKELREEHQVDEIIGITHVSIGKDLEIARKCSGIDSILGGHDHTPITLMEGSTLVVKCGQDAEYLGVMDYDFTVRCEVDTAALLSGANTDRVTLRASDPAVKNWRTEVYKQWKFVLNRNVEPHPRVLKVIQEWQAWSAAEQAEKEKHIDMDEVLAVVTNGQLTSTHVRTKANYLAETLADAMQHVSGSDIAMINGGFVRCNKVYPDGYKFTMRDSRAELPFLIGAMEIRMKGRDILLALEQHLRHMPQPAGCFPHLSRGFHVFYDVERPPLSRIVSAKFNGSPLEPDREYTVCVTLFMGGGGDGVDAYLNGANTQRDDLAKTMVSEMLPVYLRTRPQRVMDVKAPGHNRLRCISSST